jgi:hypothetical protein
MRAIKVNLQVAQDLGCVFVFHDGHERPTLPARSTRGSALRRSLTVAVRIERPREGAGRYAAP